MKEVFKVGDKIISRSNEPDQPLLIGEVLKLVQNIPVVADETGEQFLCCGSNHHYSEELLKEIEGMPAIEQWNYLTPNHCQLSDKYGVTYKTYPKDQ